MVQTTHRSPKWLMDHARNLYSQFGEDGIIEKALEVIGINDQWCVEFGAWDGKHLSNSYHLIADKSYAAVLIEADPIKFEELKANFSSNSKIICINEFVGFEPPNHLDAILARTPIPQDFDLLSIDIDGNDFHVWQAMGHYRPKLIIIEFNPTIPTSVDFVQPKDPQLTQGCSLKALVRLAKSKGYELIATTTVNGFFVDKKYFSKFDMQSNEPEALRADESAIAYVFSGYDGRVFLAGNTRMPWHNIPILANRIQQLPNCLQTFPDNYKWWQRLFFSVWKFFRSKN